MTQYSMSVQLSGNGIVHIDKIGLPQAGTEESVPRQVTACCILSLFLAFSQLSRAD